MEILTNKVKIEYEYIKDRFDIYALMLGSLQGNKEIFSKVNTLIDSFKNNGDIYSIYRCGAAFKFYFLVEKGCNNLTKEDIFDNDILEYFRNYNLIKSFGIENNISERDKLNLLLNCIKNYNFNNEKYECFDGKLYEIIESKKDYLIALKYYFQDMCLKADVVTFRKHDNFNKDKRVFHIQEKYLVKNSDKTSGYIIEGESGTKHNLDYFSGKSLQSLENCKIYRIMKMYDKFNQIYQKICKISFTKDELYEKKFESVNHKVKSDRNKALQVVRNKGVNVINNVNNTEMFMKIKFYLENNNIYYIYSDKVNIDMLNLNIIYSRKYYEDNGLEDKHLKSIEYVVQNIIYEINNDEKGVSDNNINKNKMDVIISELVHKYELIQKKIIHHDYNNLIIEKFIFGRIKCIKDNLYLRCELTIDNNNLSFKISEEEKTKFNDLKEQLYLKEKKNSFIYQIMLLPKYPLTEINNLVDAYYQTLKKVNVQEDLIPLLNEYKMNNKFEEIIDEIIVYIRNYDTISMSDLYSHIKNNLYPKDVVLKKDYSNCMKDLNKYLWNKKYKNIYFRPLWRAKGQPIKQAFEKFKYKYDDIDGLQYYSGICGSLNQSIYNGFPYRQIKYKFSADEITDYLKLLDVDDIRNSQNTVVPYPFKYITEIINMYN